VSKSTAMSGSRGALENAWRILRRRKIVVLVSLLSVPLMAYLVSSSQEKMYTATATLLFEQSEEAAFDASREVATNQALAELPAVAVQAADALGGEVTVGEVLDSVSTSSTNEMANLALIEATTESPELSAEIANAYSQAYIAFRRNADRAQISKAIELIERSLEQLPADQVDATRGAALREEIDRLEVERALRTGGTELVQPATVPSEPSSPKVSRNVFVGFVLGAILALALAALIERIDRRVRSGDELEELFGLPVVARIPHSKALRALSVEALLAAPEAEAFRVLRTNLHYLNLDRDKRSILITSPEPADGKSTVARGLAGAMAQVGDDVILIEADLRKDGDFGKTGRLRPSGLAGVLTGVPLDEALVELPVGGGSQGGRMLTVLPSGPVPPNPVELLESDAMRELLVELNSRFEHVVIDTPALGSVSDALILAPLASEILAVGGVGKTTREGIHNFLQQYELTGKPPRGLIITHADVDRSAYSYYQRSKPLLRR
jgi:polysaccharide biosynthesis transport protein